MKSKHVTLPAVASVLALSLAFTGPALSQTTTTPGSPPSSPPPVSSTTDKGVVPDGAVARANAMIGTSVRNSAGDKIGTVDDLLMGSDSKVNYAVLSVGGFLGIGDRLVAIPISDLQMAADHMVYPSATKESVSKMPKFDRSAVYYPGYVKDVPRTPPSTPSPGTGTTPRSTN
ncbi:PRC-barrel domain-containing protein [Vineibacter terrae]|uniref:PRC-barrel domain-containing protein n=1 Tax=Vineibacter terrae TaxID=2586908 RepID=UPI002E33E31E|nr:PRC-barrel domain-containing protein [Vineibacter terrae]HEX2886175.1 PRC-barrel domain-containing protein [Vineibacter terrae]